MLRNRRSTISARLEICVSVATGRSAARSLLAPFSTQGFRPISSSSTAVAITVGGR